MLATTNSKIISKIETITPERAKELLSKMIANRPLDKNRVAMYQADMEAGRWHMTGEPLIISDDGLTMNGMHRCHACIRAGVPFVSMVAYGITKEAMPSMDTGKSRSGGDVLKMNGIKHYNTVAAAVNWVQSINKKGGPLLKPGLTPRDILEWVEKNPDIEEMAGVGVATSNHVPIKGSVIAALYWLFLSVSKDAPAVEKFFEDLKTGVMLPAGDPVVLLREKLVQISNNTRERSVRADPPTYVIRAWNIRREGSVGKMLKGAVPNDKGVHMTPPIAR